MEKGIIVIESIRISYAKTYGAKKLFEIEGYSFFKNSEETCFGVIIKEGIAHYNIVKNYASASSGFTESMVVITDTKGTTLDLAIVVGKRESEEVKTLKSGELISVLLGHAKKISEEIRQEEKRKKREEKDQEEKKKK